MKKPDIFERYIDDFKEGQKDIYKLVEKWFDENIYQDNELLLILSKHIEDTIRANRVEIIDNIYENNI